MSSLSHSYSLKNCLLWCIFDMLTLHTLYFYTFQYAPAQRIFHFTPSTRTSHTSYTHLHQSCHFYHTHTHSTILCCCAYSTHIFFILSTFILFNMHQRKEFFISHHFFKVCHITYICISFSSHCHILKSSLLACILSQNHTHIYFISRIFVPFSLGLNGSLKPSKTRNKKKKKKEEIHFKSSLLWCIFCVHDI